LGTYREVGMTLHYNTKKEGERAARLLRGEVAN